MRGVDTKELVKALIGAGFQLRVEGEDFLARTRVLPVAHTATGIPADLVLAGPGLEELFLERAQIRDLDGVKVPVARAEDIVVMKILAGRPKDLEDVVAILAAHPDDLDVELTRGTLRMLEEALGQSDLLPELQRAMDRVRGAAPSKARGARGRAAPKRKPRSR